MVLSSDRAANVPSATIDLRPNRVNLAKEKGFARLDFIGIGIAVFRRPAFDHVRNVNLIARQADGLDDLRELLSRPTHKRYALQIFIPAWRFPDEHEVGIGISDSEDDRVAPRFVQLATGAITDIIPNAPEHLVGSHERHGTATGKFVFSWELAAEGVSTGDPIERVVHTGSRLVPVTPSSL